MRAASLLVAASAALLCDTGAPCRCEERTLGEYFAGSDEVAVARLLPEAPASPTPAVEPAVRLLRFELVAPLYRTDRTQPPGTGEVVTYLTATTTAECGVEAVPDGLYLLFVTRPDVKDDDSSNSDGRIDTCSGSRVILAPGMTEPAGFVDVPARFVMQQLNGLSGMDVLGRVVANAPAENGPAAGGLIGLLDVASFSHAGFARLYAEPRVDAPLVREVDSYDGLETREAGYEEPAAVVSARASGWSRLTLSDGTPGWLPPDQAGTFHRYPDVVVNRLNYIPAPWHGFVWPDPGAGLPVRIAEVSGRREVPVEVLGQMDVGGFPWLNVRVLRTSPCEGAEPRTEATGWIPAWGTRGEPSVWFYSRGC